MLALEGDPIWIELEGHGVVKQAVLDGLKETWKQLAEMEIPKKITSGLGISTRSVVEAEFPKYLELPELARENILSYLTDPYDELNVAKAIPSEVQFLSGPLNLIQLKAVFPILMKKNLLGSIDVMNLCGADPYIQGFIRQYFERVLWKDRFYNTSRYNMIYLEQVESALEVNPDMVVLPRVFIYQFDQATWQVLRRCGSKILHCHIRLSGLVTDLQELDWIKCYLELLPNLRALSIDGDHMGMLYDSPLERPTPPTTPEFLPELTFLKNLHFEDDLFLRKMMLEKYGPQLELLSLHSTGNS